MKILIYLYSIKILYTESHDDHLMVQINNVSISIKKISRAKLAI